MIVALAIGLALGIQAFVVKPYQIPSESMEPTLDVGQRVLVNRLTYRLGADPGPGDVVVFHPPAGRRTRTAAGSTSRPHPGASPARSRPPEMAEENFIKRVVARPGDTLSIRRGIPIVNGEPVRGDWEIRKCGGVDVCNLPDEITIPEDHYFMMGDNRGLSDDSRYWGPVPRDWIVGSAFATYWPPDRIGFL